LGIRFDRRIDRKFARNTTIGDVLNALSVEERRRWENVFESFKKAWNTGLKHVDRYTCLEIPAMFKDIQMSEKTPLCFSLADEGDEGVCMLALVQFMVDSHNKFLQKLSQIGVIGSSHYRVPTSLLIPQHIISYSTQYQLIPLLQIHAILNLDYGTGGDITYNFENIEQYLIDTILSGKPYIDLHMKKFNFANETRKTGALSNLKFRIPQIELPIDIKARILQELSTPQSLRNCLQILEICIGFILASGGSVLQQVPGKVYLVEYIKNTLLLNNVPEMSGGSIIEKICPTSSHCFPYYIIRTETNS